MTFEQVKHCWIPNCGCPVYECMVVHGDGHTCVNYAHKETCQYYGDSTKIHFEPHRDQMTTPEEKEADRKFWEKHIPGEPIILNDGWMDNLRNIKGNDER